MKQLRLAVVTGGASNIGKETVKELFQRGNCHVAIWDLDLVSADQIAKGLNSFPNPLCNDGVCEVGLGEGSVAANGNGNVCKAFKVDVTNLESVRQAVIDTNAQFGGEKIDILVNGVGFVVDEFFLQKSLPAIRKEIDINLVSVIYCIQQVLPQMIENKSGCVVNIASDAGRIGEFRESVYSAAKAGVIALTKSLAKEYSPKGIRFNSVCPGLTPGDEADVSDTSMWNTPQMKKIFGSKETLTKIASTYPLRRLGRASDTANTVAFLCSDKASYITGQTISVSGGYSML